MSFSIFLATVAAVTLCSSHVFTLRLPEGVTLPPGFSLPPGFTLPPDFTIPDLDDLPVEYVAVHQALILPRGATVNTGRAICSGALLLNYTIVTSASCLLKADGSFYNADELSVAVGFLTIKIDGLDNSIEPQYFDVRQVITHERFNKNLKINNLALLKLSGNIEISQAIIPMIHSNVKVYGEKDCVALGWRNYNPVAVNVTAISRSICESTEDELSLEKFCVRAPDGQDPCDIDDGSAIVCSGMLQGIVSSSCSEGKIVVTDVSQSYYWLFIMQLGDLPDKLIDSEQLRYFLGSILDFVAWYSKDPALADKIDVLKMFF